MANSLASLTSSLTSALQQLPSVDQLVESERMQLLGALDGLRAAIEPPMVTLQNLTQADHALVAAKIAMSMGVFDAYASHGNKALTLSELNSLTKGDTSLLFRVMRLLSAQGFFKPLDVTKWEPLPLGTMFPTGGPPAAAVTHFYAHLKSHAALLDYLKKTGFKDPDDAFNGPWQHALGTKKSYFEWLGEDAEQQEAFNTIMTINQQFRGQDWFDFYPVMEKLAGAAPDDVLIIDIGGGIGHDISAFRQNFPNLSGKFVLQELAQVVKSIKEPLPLGIEAQAYDMFTPQPIKNARVYYLRTVLHDWPDKQALLALKSIREAMGADSRLLLNENLFPEGDAPKLAPSIDFIMMNSFASLERTERQWGQLLQKAGFRVEKVWRPTSQGIGPVALFEAVPEV